MNFKFSHILSALLCACLLLSMIGCKDKDPISEEPYYQQSSDFYDESNVGMLANDTVLCYMQYLFDGDYKSAYSMIQTDNELFTYEMYIQTKLITDMKEGLIPRTLYTVQDTGNSFVLMYGIKSGEKYSDLSKKDKKKGVEAEYLGDFITDSYTVEIKYAMSVGKVSIGVCESELSTETVALKTLEGVRVYMYGNLLDERQRDDYGFYLISGFLNMPTLTVTLETDVESCEVTLDLGYTSYSSDYSSDGTDTEEATASYNPFATEHPNGYKAFDITVWDLSRQTKDDAISWLNSGLQVAYQSYEKEQRDIYNSDLCQLFSKKANIEDTKPQYAKNLENYASTKSKYYDDCTIIGVYETEADILEKKGEINAMLNGITLEIYVDISYSYYVNTVDTVTGELLSRSIRNGYISNVPIQLTQDDGYWRFMFISPLFFKNLT